MVDLLFRGLETSDNRRSSNRFENPSEKAMTKLSHGPADAIPRTLLWRKHRIAGACLGAAVGFVAWLTG
jgi:hypothetical protein